MLTNFDIVDAFIIRAREIARGSGDHETIVLAMEASDRLAALNKKNEDLYYENSCIKSSISTTYAILNQYIKESP